MSYRGLAAFALGCLWVTAHAQTPTSFDPATAFGARPSVHSLHLSPDGMSVVYIAPAPGQGSVAYTLNLKPGSRPRVALTTDGKPYRIGWCRWASNDRLVCLAYAVA